MYLLTICGQSLGVLSKGKKRNKPISYLRYMNAKKGGDALLERCAKSSN